MLAIVVGSLAVATLTADKDGRPPPSRASMSTTSEVPVDTAAPYAPAPCPVWMWHGWEGSEGATFPTTLAALGV